MINSYLHEIPLKSVKYPLSDKACAPRPTLEKKKSKTISSIYSSRMNILNAKGSATNI